MRFIAVEDIQVPFGPFPVTSVKMLFSYPRDGVLADA
jgi:hypothetical protein